MEIHPLRLEDINIIPDLEQKYMFFKNLYCKGFTYLMKLCLYGNLKALEEYIICNPLEVDVQNEFGFTSLMIVAGSANNPYFFENENIAGDVAKILIKHGADINIITNIRGSPQSLLGISITCETENILKILLDNGIDVNKRYVAGECMLMKLLIWNNNLQYRERVINMLLDAKADPNIQKDDGGTVLMLAARNSAVESISSEKIVQMLLDAKADPNIQTDSGTTALALATKEVGHISTLNTVKILLEARADPNLENKDGVHPIEFIKTSRDRDGALRKVIIKAIQQRAAEDAISKFVGVYCMEHSRDIPNELISDITKKVE